MLQVRFNKLQQFIFSGFCQNAHIVVLGLRVENEKNGMVFGVTFKSVVTTLINAFHGKLYQQCFLLYL